MNLYLMRVCDAPGPAMDTEKGLSELGKKQASDMAAFMVRMVGRVDIVISSHFQCAIQTGEIMAKALGSYVATTTALAAEQDQTQIEEIERLAQQAAEVLVIIQNDTLLDRMEIGADMEPGAIAFITPNVLNWLFTPQIG